MVDGGDVVGNGAETESAMTDEFYLVVQVERISSSVPGDCKWLSIAIIIAW